MFDPNNWPHLGWQKNKESYAKGLSIEELKGALKDCQEASRVCTGEENKYRDEAHIYFREFNRRMNQKQRALVRRCNKICDSM